ncbi:hypothetical protein ACTXT7_004399 [Hymenolepis weldensis]
MPRTMAAIFAVSIESAIMSSESVINSRPYRLNLFLLPKAEKTSCMILSYLHDLNKAHIAEFNQDRDGAILVLADFKVCECNEIEQYVPSLDGRTLTKEND